jgi:hypothetical protein
MGEITNPVGARILVFTVRTGRDLIVIKRGCHRSSTEALKIDRRSPISGMPSSTVPVGNDGFLSDGAPFTAAHLRR